MIKNIKMNDKLTFEQLPSAVGQLLEGFQNLQKEVSDINGLCQTIAETNARMDKKKSNDTEAMYLNVKEVNCSIAASSPFTSGSSTVIFHTSNLAADLSS